jgi:hypothetical protein
VVVRVYAGDAKTKGNPLAESTGFLGSAIAVPGSSNVDWTTGSTAATAATPGTTPVTPPVGTPPVPTAPISVAPTPPATTSPSNP